MKQECGPWSGGILAVSLSMAIVRFDPYLTSITGRDGNGKDDSNDISLSLGPGTP